MITSGVVVVELPDESGTLADTSGKLARERIDINFVYGTAQKCCESSAIVFAVSDVEKAVKLLG